MVPKTNRFVFSFGMTLMLVLSTFVISAQPARAAPFIAAGHDLPALVEFVHELENGRSEELRGAYAPTLFAHLVVQQPQGDPGYVSRRQSILTQFSLASQLGSIALLAHNDRAGTEFSSIQDGQVIYLIFGDGSLRRYSVTQLFRFQASQPNSAHSDFINLETGSRLTSQSLFSRMYDRPGALILQTCIEADGIGTWGRLFVIAVPSDLQETHHLAFPGR